MGLHPPFGGCECRCYGPSVQAPAFHRQTLAAARWGLAGGAAPRAPGVLLRRLPGTFCFPPQRRGGQGRSAWVSALVRVADYYSPAMLGLQTDQEVLGELVRTKLPAVAALMDGHGVLWTLVVSRWFICLFVDILPMETVLRIWDCLFNEGSKIIFRVALTLIKQHQAFILEATSVADICERFKEITRGSFVTECHTFMQKIFTEPGSLSMATIIRLRESCRARLQAQG
ncbi:growth hormone-regulated TBC protein 1 isoform X1 [Leptonychotes weddellii]|uniref:Growth hormone-regulated TBC protein 1 isoform X1 n=1 Tax=Leptonychotes weddellii TaxID=9713 RepID=A0A7F8R967_LEPWE|nr:growth hormone-regulated TBC protein 1 isoform X1 [Leptonychotes weddellii]